MKIVEYKDYGNFENLSECIISFRSVSNDSNFNQVPNFNIQIWNDFIWGL